MSDYRRLISYIYEYEGKTKGKNVGFVKLEARNGQCRLQVNIKQMYVGGNSIGVYLLGKGEKKTLLGNMFTRNGIGEFRTIVDAVNVEGTGDGMDTYYGLTVHDVKNSWRSYRTIWEDVEIVETAKPQMVESETARLAELENVQPVEQEDFRSAGAERLQPVEPETLQPTELTNSQISDQTELRAAEVATEKSDDPMLGEINETKEITDESGQESVEKSDEAINKQMTEEVVIEKPATENMSASEASVPSAIISPELENPEVLRYLQETEQKPTNPEALWQELRKTYPKIQPFDYDGESEVLTIRPDDIGQLPRENWIYGNNSFLMHGYYNFRYLILVRLNQPGKRSRYLLGVPGHYYSNEKYMANMFGFPNFVLSKKQPPNDGRFGYWYTDVKMG